MPEKIRDTFVVASDITPEEHVRMQAAMQAFVDNSMSKTINFPATATADDVEKAYFLAWKLGCKGITVYVAGTREQVVLETRETSTADKSRQSAEVSHEKAAPARGCMARRTRSRRRSAKRTSPSIATARMQPFEVFCNVGKAGSDTAAVSEAIGRLISLALRMPSPLSPTERWTGRRRNWAASAAADRWDLACSGVRSLPDGIAQALSRRPGAAARQNRKTKPTRSNCSCSRWATCVRSADTLRS